MSNIHQAFAFISTRVIASDSVAMTIFFSY
jgi:hypothetical protein